MEKQTKPENLYIGRKRWLAAIAALIFLAFFAVLAIVLPLGLIKHPPEGRSTLILLCIGSALLAVFSLLHAALNIRNLFFPYILTSDEKGIYNYSGLYHFGFISWEDINSFGKDATILDVLDNDTPNIKIFVSSSFKSKLSFGKKWALFWSYGEIKIYTLCSQIKKKELWGLLEASLKYYKPSDETKVNDER